MNSPAPYSIGPAKYAGRYASNAMKAVKCPSDGGYKSRAARLAQALKGRYTSRERAYILSERKAAKFEALYAAGYDANPVSGELIPPRGAEPHPHPLPKAPPTLEQFMAGASVRYTGYSNSAGVSREFVAVYKTSPRFPRLKFLEVREAGGKLVMAPMYDESSARQFFNSLGRSIIQGTN